MLYVSSRFDVVVAFWIAAGRWWRFFQEPQIFSFFVYFTLNPYALKHLA